MYKLFYKDSSLWWNIKQLRHLPSAIAFRWQRAWRGWADCDTWGIDCWFSEIMPQMLKYLKENRNGYPILRTDIPEEENSKLWDDTLFAMIFLLKEMDKETSSEQNEVWDNRFTKKIDGGIEVEIDQEAFIKRQKEVTAYRDLCRKSFFNLFCEHFESLWD